MRSALISSVHRLVLLATTTPSLLILLIDASSILRIAQMIWRRAYIMTCKPFPFAKSTLMSDSLALRPLKLAVRRNVAMPRRSIVVITMTWWPIYALTFLMLRCHRFFCLWLLGAPFVPFLCCQKGRHFVSKSLGVYFLVD